jgi:hypothetical protein
MKDTEIKPTTADMLRMTVQKTDQFYAQLADHIEKIEFENEMLVGRIAELTALNGDA